MHIFQSMKYVEVKKVKKVVGRLTGMNGYYYTSKKCFFLKKKKKRNARGIGMQLTSDNFYNFFGASYISNYF